MVYMRNKAKNRASGILLHITSLPSKYGIGDFGDGAYKFADFLAAAKQKYWQLLPLNPPSFVKGSPSPYNCTSAFAGNNLLISPELLYQDGLLNKKDIAGRPEFADSFVDFKSVVPYKKKLLELAFRNFKNIRSRESYERFCCENQKWLNDFALFVSIRRYYKSKLWCDWPKNLRDRKREALEEISESLSEDIEREKFLQYLFFKQWTSLKEYCSSRGIQIIGDIPYYVAYDSCDVWANPEIFELSKSKKPRFIAGVPPDLFNKNGQLWGNPVYNWPVLKKMDYAWWFERMQHNLELFDIVRIDHFRGFFDYWQVPASDKTAAGGKWIKTPGEHFFDTLLKQIPSSRFIVEDLGYITSRIKRYIAKANLTNTKVLLFGFNKAASENSHHPSNYKNNCAVYTSTHDNNTVRGWFENDAAELHKQRLFETIGREVSADKISWELIRLAESSKARLVIVPLQDCLGLGASARMNRPGTVKGNWLWRFRAAQLTEKICKRLKAATVAGHRG